MAVQFTRRQIRKARSLASEASRIAGRKYYWAHRTQRLAYRRKLERVHATRYRTQRAEYRKTNKAAIARRRRVRNLKQLYGLSPEQYNEWLVRQNGVCAICRQPESAIDRRTRVLRHLAVDHNHRTGKIRGLLCSRCNPAVGYVQEDPLRARALAGYLELHTHDVDQPD